MKKDHLHGKHRGQVFVLGGFFFAIAILPNNKTSRVEGVEKRLLSWLVWFFFVVFFCFTLRNDKISNEKCLLVTATHSTHTHSPKNSPPLKEANNANNERAYRRMDGAQNVFGAVGKTAFPFSESLLERAGMRKAEWK